MISTAIVPYDPTLPIHMKDTIVLLGKTSDTLKTCPFCNSFTTKFFQTCISGCLSCDHCDEVLGEDYFYKESKRGKKCRQCKGECLTQPIYNKAFTELAATVQDINVELNHGLQQVKNHGYITEGMANGEPAPEWAPINRKQAILEATEFLKNDPNLAKLLNPNKKKSGVPKMEDFENEHMVSLCL